LIRRRDYNVSSLVVGATDRSGTSRMVLVVEAANVHQIVQQLSRLIDVLSVAEVRTRTRCSSSSTTRCANSTFQHFLLHPNAQELVR
jgi:acetolactate synthase small subunit